jgi:hypothetical protein
MAKVILEVQVKEGRKERQKKVKGCSRGAILFIIRCVVGLVLFL